MCTNKDNLLDGPQIPLTTGLVSPGSFSPSPRVIPTQETGGTTMNRLASYWQRLSRPERRILLTKLSLLNKSSAGLGATAHPALFPMNAMDLRHGQRLQAASQRVVLKARKLSQANSMSPPPLLNKSMRRISSSLTESQKMPSTLQDDSTIGMRLSMEIPDMLQGEDLDNIFDDLDSFTEEEEPAQSPLFFENHRPGPLYPSFLPASLPRRQVSEASFSFAKTGPAWLPRTRSLTPKEAGLSTWDDVSSLGTLTRWACLEPEPIPMGETSIPLVIFVPNDNCNAVEEDLNDDFEPLHVFSPGANGATMR